MEGNIVKDCSKLDSSLEVYYLTTMYAAEFILGFLGNTVVICGYIFCVRDWKSFNVYLFSLAVSDLAFLCTLPSLVINYSQGIKVTDTDFCLSNRYLLHVNLYSSILFHTWISIDRYLILKHPLRQHILLKRNTAVFVSLCIWVFVTLQLLPLLTFIDMGLDDNNQTHCKDYASSGDASNSLIYSLFLTVSGYMLPMAFLCCFYYKIARFLKARNGVFENSSFQRPLKLITITGIMFFVLYTPYHIMRNVRISSRRHYQGDADCTLIIINCLYIISRPIAFSHSVINPLFYFLMGDHFRETLLGKVRSIINRK
uniref:Succinate receptor 1 n=1 Tax=Lepisosteus oculatus TaxID=7918 RepID=W5M1S5_LEPOC|nr:PREDICTED: succinate receptor 1-like [Lepisosteus oculatus]